VPLPELPARLAELQPWQDKPIVIVCRSGRRSLDAARILARAGFRDARSLDGGMIAWRESERR
jgi:rhodanese-related sulfurtransferase